jgi:hypothetical protein
MLQFFVPRKACFVEFFGGVFEDGWKTHMFAQGVPSGVAAAGWLFDRLMLHGWPTRREAPDLVLNELHIPMLHSAVLRSFRLTGRPDLIEEQLSHAYHVWFAMKCLLERSLAGKLDAELAPRLTRLVDASPCKGAPILGRVISEICDSGVNVPEAGVSAPAHREPTAPSVSHLSYTSAVRALSGGCPDFKPTTPVVLEPVDAKQLERLASLADPANDRDRRIETYVPIVSFTANGHLVSRRQMTLTGNQDSPGTFIRPAIAAANGVGLNIPWHEELLTGVLASTYVPKFLDCLGAQKDSVRFYDELEGNPDVLLPQICKAERTNLIVNHIDTRIVPFLLRYASAGTDEFFQGLCTLALRINTPRIDAVLFRLLYRWTQRFDSGSPVLQHDQNHELWQGFRRLAEHPRFSQIEGWPSCLASVLRMQISWHRRQDIVRVLERDPRSYIQIESLLFRAENWEHFIHDEIDRLDNAADRLFPQLLED